MGTGHANVSTDIYLIYGLSKCVIIFCLGLQTGNIAFLIGNLSYLDYSLFLDWNGMPYKCM